MSKQWERLPKFRPMLWTALALAGVLLAPSAKAQVFYRTSRYSTPATMQSFYYQGPQGVAAPGPRNVTWYTVGSGYTGSLQTGLPWRRGVQSGDLPDRFVEASPGSVARFSRVTSRDYYARNVNRRTILPNAYPSERFDNNVEIAADRPSQPVTSPPAIEANLQNASASERKDSATATPSKAASVATPAAEDIELPAPPPAVPADLPMP